MDRVAKALNAIDLTGRGLEIGPSYNPLVRKADGHRVETVDHATQEDLVAKYRGFALDETLLARIEPVDHVWHGGSLVDLVGGAGQYDYIVASHFLEHTVDLIGFLTDCQTLLRDGGRLSLVLPDKRFCFDLFQPLSTVGDIVDAHQHPTAFHSAGPLIDHQAYACTNAGALVWSDGWNADLALQFPRLEGGAEALRNATEQAEYFDTHRWKFTPASFDLLVRDLRTLDQHDFGLVESYPTEGFEFFRTLENGRPDDSAPDRLTELLRIEGELAEVFVGRPDDESDRVADGGDDEELLTLRRKNARLQAECDHWERVSAHHRRLLAELQASRSWRITAPVRAASERARRRLGRG